MKKAIVFAILVCASFFHGFASADDFTSQVQATQSQSLGQGVTLSETFGKLKSFGSSVTTGISSKIAAVSGLSRSESAAPVEEASFKSLTTTPSDGLGSTQGSIPAHPAFNAASSKQNTPTVNATAYSRTRCVTTVKGKGVEDKVCETTYLTSKEGSKYFQ